MQAGDENGVERQSRGGAVDRFSFVDHVDHFRRLEKRCRRFAPASLCHRTPKRARPVGSRDSFTNSVTLLPFYKRRTQQLAHRMHELWVGQGTYFGVRPGRLLSVGMLFIKRIPIHALTRIRQRSASAVHPANGASGCLRCAKSGIYVQARYKPNSH